MMKSDLNFSRFNLIIFMTFLISLSLSFWTGYRDNVINPDGICYLLSAKSLSSGSIKEAMHFCPQAHWPFYSILIYGIAKITHFSYLHAAQFLNAFFSLLSVSAFLFIIRELGANKWILILASFVFLFNHQLNVLRDNVIRDHGFWAFYLLSLLLILRFFNTSQYLYGLFWSASLFVATLFRIEGIIFLLFIPLIALFASSKNWSSRLHAFILLNIPIICFALIATLWLQFNQKYQFNDLGRVYEAINQLLHGWQKIRMQYLSVKLAIAHYVLPRESYADTGAVTLIMELGWYLYNIIITFSFGYTLLVCYAWWQGIVSFSKQAKWVVMSYLVLNACITLGFLAENLFISKRYLIAMALTLMIWVPFAVYDLIIKFHSTKHRIALLIILFFMGSSSISGIIEFGYSKTYIKHAGQWIDENIPKNATLYANDFQLMYYSHHFGDDIFKILPNFLNIGVISQQRWQEYDYLALKLNNKEDAVTKEVLSEISMQPIKDFKNKRGNHIAIYQIKPKDHA